MSATTAAIPQAMLCVNTSVAFGCKDKAPNSAFYSPCWPLIVVAEELSCFFLSGLISLEEQCINILSIVQMLYICE